MVSSKTKLSTGIEGRRRHIDTAARANELALIDLRHAEPRAHLRIGSKAANLASLLQAGFPVPEGMVLTTDAFAEFVEANGLGDGTSPEEASSATLPEDLVRLLADGVTRFGDAQLAVRSSSVGEDLPGASFAGQYETILNVAGLAELEQAVLRCWASAFSTHLAGYRHVRRLAAAPMAVLIHPMVDAEAAGVAFTANPVTGRRDEIVINAVKGLGDRLVSGEASPDEWMVRGDTASCASCPEDAIDHQQALAIAELSRSTEAHFRTPQDVEWAIDKSGEILLLQSRPITSLPEPQAKPIPIEFEVPPGFWQRDPSHSPRAGYHLDLLFFPLIERTSRRWSDEFGYLFEGLEFAEFGLWPYMRMVPLGGKDRAPPPQWVMWLAVRTLPEMRRRISTAKSAVRSRKADRFVEQWYEKWHPELAEAITAHRSVRLPSLTDVELEGHIDALLDLLERGIEVHSLLSGALAIVLYEFAGTCEELLEWDLGKALELVSGISYKSTEPARRLHDLAQMADFKPHVRAALEDRKTTPDVLESVDGEYSEAFAAYLHDYGARALGYSVAEPTLSEMPEVFLGMIRGQLEDRYDPGTHQASSERARERALQEAHSRLTPEQFDSFEDSLHRAIRAYPVREDNEFFTLSAPIALLRYSILELGRRLADRGVITSRDDVRFIELEQARTALRDPKGLHEMIERRQGRRVWAEMNPGPDFYGDPPEGPPKLDFLPADARLPMEALLWSFNEMLAIGFAAEETESDLRGIAASPGSYTGPVRVVMDETDFHKLQPGDVLVCPITSPVWSILFPIVGALVTDVGGVLSHSAIIAREYQIPAVVATSEATTRLHDGDRVTVDGTNGTVAREIPAAATHHSALEKEDK